MRATSKLFLSWIAVFLAVGILPSVASAATQIYYSVGQNTTDHKTGSPTISISGTTATFSLDQNASNMGVGDKITFGGSSVFITGRTSSSTWSVSTATGTTPVATTTATVTSVTHAFSSLRAAVGAYVAGNATSTNFLNTSDLVGGNYLLNIPLYYDTGPDTTGVTIAGYTTDATHYLRLYTPTSTTEVNYSQRHGGRWTSTAWRMDAAFNFNPALIVSTPYTRLDGLQVRNTTTSGTAYGVNINTSTADSSYVSNGIFSTSGDLWTCVNFAGGNASSQIRAWNNVFTNCKIGLAINNGTMGSSWVYNNTFYDALTGISLTTFGTASVKAINNLFGSTTSPFTSTGKAAAGSDYNSTATSSLGYIVSGGAGGHDRLSQTPSFVDTSNLDFHLTSSDTSAKDLGTTTANDANLAVVDDIDGNARPYNSIVDIGADEFNGATGDVTPPVLSAGSPTGPIATSSTSTTLSITTSEAATCKYDTAANTAYASMANTFSTTGGTSHSTTVSGLSSGHLYSYYVRCQDGSGNANTSDYTISFNTGTNGTAYANSCSQADINAAIGIAVSGDTVSVPAGTCNYWSSGSYVNVNKSVTIQGAGQGQTIINIGTTSSTYGNAVLRISAANATVRGMTINTNGTSIGNTGTAFSASGNNFRITDIAFVEASSTPNGYFAYISNVYGLIDNVDVTGGGGTDELIFVYGPSNSWQTNDSLGSSSALYIENSTFRGPGYVDDCNANSRCVLRNLTITGSMKTDSHGAASNTPFRGVRQTEIYNNTWTASFGSATAIEMRGGTGMVFNNSVPNTANGTNGAWFYLRDYAYDGGPWTNFGTSISSISVGNPTTITTASPHGLFDQQSVTLSSTNSTPTVNSTYIATVTGANTFTIPVNVTGAGTSGTVSDFQTLYDYPVIDQIGVGKDPKAAGSDPYYVWGNTKGAGTWPLTIPSIPANAITTYRAQIGSSTATYAETDVIQSNRDYFADSGVDTSTTTVGVTSGLLANIPATCKAGVGYWATDAGGNWNTWNATANDGALYKCTSANSWTQYYIPYAYPHYLTAASTTATDKVDIGGGARFFGTGKFYTIATSTATGQLADIAATTTYATADNWLDVTISAWNNSGTREKTWTESSTNLHATTTHHMIGDLSANTQYNVKIDGSLATATISGPNCTAGVCTSDASGRIYFDYTGGYSTHTFDVKQSSGIVVPTIDVPAASSLTSTSAVLSSNILSNGGDPLTDEGFVYGPTSAYGATSTTFSNVGFSGTISGLTCNTTYHAAGYGTNGAGTGYSSDATFTTSACAAAAATTPAPVVSGLGGGFASAYTAPVFAPGYMPKYSVAATPVSLSAPITITPVIAAKLAAVAPVSRPLDIGATSVQVRSLQTILNTLGFTVAKSGAGSPGHETTYFGPLTTKAVEAFQLYYNLATPKDPGFGYVGPKTRGKISQLAGKR